MANNIKFNELDNYFTEPKIISPYFNVKRIPRKLKKKVKLVDNVAWDILDNNQRLWCQLTKINPNFSRFLIKKITEK